MKVHYLTRFKHPEKGWIISTFDFQTTKEEAKKQLAKDVSYFYDNIEIQLVEVTEKVLETQYGSNARKRDKTTT